MSELAIIGFCEAGRLQRLFIGGGTIFLPFLLSFGGGVYAAKTGNGHADKFLVFLPELFRDNCSGASPLSAKPEGFSARPKDGGTIFLLLQKDPKSSRGHPATRGSNLRQNRILMKTFG